MAASNRLKPLINTDEPRAKNDAGARDGGQARRKQINSTGG